MAYNPKTNWRNNDIVTPEDLNRIERGIAESASPADDVILYIAPSGSDDTGTGQIDKPFRTFQKAIDTLPICNGLGKLCVIKIAEGQYPGFIMCADKRIELSAQGTIQILGDVIINDGTLIFVDETGGEVYLIDSTLTMTGGNFMSMIQTAVTTSDQISPRDGVAIDCSVGSKFGVHADLIITHRLTAIRCSHSHMTLKRLLTDATPTGIVCECGIVQLGDDVIQASAAKFVTQDGGRIYVGAQSSTPNY